VALTRSVPKADTDRTMLLGRSNAPRWPRGQKFSLSPAGVTAEESYRAAVAGARGAGRTALDTALAAWASPLAVAPGDGLILEELHAKARGLGDVSGALEDAGIEAAEVRLAMDRLVKAGLVALLPLASQAEKEPAPVRPTRWQY
jgi:hypothetical protein